MEINLSYKSIRILTKIKCILNKRFSQTDPKNRTNLQKLSNK